jgi:hypothetical protein
MVCVKIVGTVLRVPIFRTVSYKEDPPRWFAAVGEDPLFCSDLKSGQDDMRLTHLAF